MNKLILHHRTEEYPIDPETGISLLSIIRDLEIPGFSAPCGGAGTCGKCRIIIKSGILSPVTDQEKKHLSQFELSQGIRLACLCTIPENCAAEIIVPEEAESRIQAFSSLLIEEHHPRFRLVSVSPASAGLEDQRSDFERLIDALQTPEFPVLSYQLDPSALRMLSQNGHGAKALPHQETGNFFVLTDGDQLSGVFKSDEHHYGFAVDIGTTTVVVHLVDLIDGTIFGTWSGLNEQKRFGADVISRIQFSMENPKNTETLRRTIVRELDNAMSSLLIRAKIPSDRCRVIAIAGNTTMLHMLTGCETAGIAASPFIPIFTESLTFVGYQLDFTAVPHALVELLPSISAYVGADITAGICVTNLSNRSKPSLLLDIGTNGEMAIGDHHRVICCSTAAGPAFEGANIKFGTGGVTGAIDSVKLIEGKLTITTIGGAPPIGICGSGIIDAAALLVLTGTADYTGRILDPEECDVPWIVNYEGSPALLLALAEETRSGSPIYFTQKDMREVQLAKAAIAGGIRTLIADRGIEIGDIEQVFLAGGFGSYINSTSAGIIGLLPETLSSVTVTAGNTAGEGAVRLLLDRYAKEKMARIKRECVYVELSARSDFQNYYVQEMYFGDD